MPLSSAEKAGLVADIAALKQGVDALVTDDTPPPAQTIDSFTATPSSITAGQSTTLSWSTSNATAVTLDGVSVPLSGSVVKTPAASVAYRLVASGAAPDVSTTTSVTVQAAQGNSPPLWVAPAKLLEWLAIPGTKLVGSDISVQIAAGYVDNTWGRRDHGIMDFSGGTLDWIRYLLWIHGGGGAGAWRGNDWRYLALLLDWPKWLTAIPPDPPSTLWPHEAAGQPLNPHGYLNNNPPTPNACHSYWSLQYSKLVDKLFRFYTSAVGEDDSGFFPNTNAISPVTKVWDPKGAHPDCPIMGSNACTTTDRDSGLVYIGGYNDVFEYNPTTDLYRSIHTNITEPQRGVIAVGLGIVMCIRSWISPLIVTEISLATGARTDAVLTGVSLNGKLFAGFVFDPGLQAFVMFCDDGNLYTIKRTDATHWNVAVLATTGVGPPPGGAAIHGGAVWGRFQHVPAGHGIPNGLLLVQSADVDAKFLPTA